jgi:hypothetical protein
MWLQQGAHFSEEREVALLHGHPAQIYMQLPHFWEQRKVPWGWVRQSLMDLSVGTYVPEDYWQNLLLLA